MSHIETNEPRKGRGSGKPGPSWSDHEIVYLLTAIEQSDPKVDFNAALAPFGRNPAACAKKMSKLKNALRTEMDAIKNGQPLAVVPGGESTPKKSTPRKRKAKADIDESGEGSPKKPRARAKKTESELMVKDEPEGEVEIEVEM